MDVCTRPDLAELLRPAAAAELLGISTRTLNDWAKAGALPHRETPGGHRRYRRDEIAKIAAQLSRGERPDLVRVACPGRT